MSGGGRIFTSRFKKFTEKMRWTLGKGKTTDKEDGYRYMASSKSFDEIMDGMKKRGVEIKKVDRRRETGPRFAYLVLERRQLILEENGQGCVLRFSYSNDVM